MRREAGIIIVASLLGPLLVLGIACTSTVAGTQEQEQPADGAGNVDPVDAASSESFVPADADAGTDSAPPCSLRVFVSSARYSGNMGGRGGGDNRCETLADNANLGTGATWVAWLSTTQVNAIDLLPQGGVWCLVDRFTFVATKAELATGTLHHAIDTLESGALASEPGGPSVPTATWTGTLESGLTAANNCDNWTKDGALTLGARGNYAAKNGEWTRWPGAGGVTAVACSNNNRLYCFETN